MEGSTRPLETREVAIFPSFPNRILVRENGGSFTAMSIERFVARMVNSAKGGENGEHKVSAS